jgi:4'-phosphopantetheinyl transferase
MSVVQTAESSHAVQLWLLPEASIVAADAVNSYAAWLSDDERQRWQCFVQPADQRRFLLARALTRGVLGAYTGQAPAELQFTRNAYGKPQLRQSSEQPLSFNLSHTQGLLALAVSSAPDVGVDVESAQRNVAMLALAERYFHVAELQWLRSAEPAQLRARFFQLWTLKEAYVKARGLGLQLGLSSFALQCEQVPPVLLEADDANAQQWQFASLTYAEHFQLGLALPSAAPMQLRVKEWDGKVPLMVTP